MQWNQPRFKFDKIKLLVHMFIMCNCYGLRVGIQKNGSNSFSKTPDFFDAKNEHVNFDEIMLLNAFKASDIINYYTLRCN